MKGRKLKGADKNILIDIAAGGDSDNIVATQLITVKQGRRKQSL